MSGTSRICVMVRTSQRVLFLALTFVAGLTAIAEAGQRSIVTVPGTAALPDNPGGTVGATSAVNSGLDLSLAEIIEVTAEGSECPYPGGNNYADGNSFNAAFINQHGQPIILPSDYPALRYCDRMGTGPCSTFHPITPSGIMGPNSTGTPGVHSSGPLPVPEGAVGLHFGHEDSWYVDNSGEMTVATTVVNDALLGGLDAQHPPSIANSALYTLEDLYNRLMIGALGVKRSSGFAEPASGPGATMHTLDAIMHLMPEMNSTQGASAADVPVGRTFWGLRSGSGWGPQTGSRYPALVPKTGQTSCNNPEPNKMEAIDCDNSGQDGNLQMGFPLPNPRFTINVNTNADTGVGGGTAEDGICNGTEECNGTVTDNLTGLIWLRNANCPRSSRNWVTALSDVTSLNSSGKMNNNNCGDTSKGGSYQTDWRLPNIRELHSLQDYGYFSPGLSNAAGDAKWSDGDAFFSLKYDHEDWYLSSSSNLDSLTYIWATNLDGKVNVFPKSGGGYVWPVRGGH